MMLDREKFRVPARRHSGVHVFQSFHRPVFGQIFITSHRLLILVQDGPPGCFALGCTCQILMACLSKAPLDHLPFPLSVVHCQCGARPAIYRFLGMQCPRRVLLTECMDSAMELRTVQTYMATSLHKMGKKRGTIVNDLLLYY